MPEPTVRDSFAIVFGATGNVGHGAAAALVEAGAIVLAPTRRPSGVEALKRAFEGRVEPVLGDISDPNDAPRLVQELLSHGAPDHVFASMGGWWQGGTLAGQTPSEWAGVRAMLLDGHVNAAALLLPHLRPDPASSYTVVTGMGAHHLMPGTGLLFVAVNGVLALSKVLRAEATEGVRINELLIQGRVEKVGRPGVVPSLTLGRSAVALMSSDARGQIVPFGGR